MKIEMDNISIILQHEDSGIDRKLLIEDDGEFLQINFIGESDKQGGAITLTKKQTILLRDNLNTFIKNKLED